MALEKCRTCCRESDQLSAATSPPSFSNTVATGANDGFVSTNRLPFGTEHLPQRAAPTRFPCHESTVVTRRPGYPTLSNESTSLHSQRIDLGVRHHASAVQPRSRRRHGDSAGRRGSQLGPFVRTFTGRRSAATRVGAVHQGVCLHLAYFRSRSLLPFRSISIPLTLSAAADRAVRHIV